MESKHTDQANVKAKLSTMHSKVICCKLYISESQNAAVVDAISRIGQKDPEVVLLNKFEDEYYNRVRYTLVSYITNESSTGGAVFSPIRKVLLAMIEAAFSAINLEVHCGTHPRIGVVDDISFHPLNQADTIEDAAQLAKLVASDIGNGLQVFLYAAAHPTSKSVSAVRRELGYFRPNHKGVQWAGPVLPDTLPMKPDVGPVHVPRERGATMVGAQPLVESYNVPIFCKDVPTVRRITRRVTGRSGGLPSVQALALFHGDNCTEIACFLLDPDHVGADRVQWLVEQIAEEQGLEVEKGYFTDLSKHMMLERYSEMVSAAD
ncbi:hypothetical protein CFC21_007947 [Triticum aestivum]|uniref:glutamate formimidoyltransferase n=3 Tax=Triticum TaxID=4564 RepID=A0A9R0R0A3_TRITD|nr:hypothetical protein CFC21_007947 [Triticum aestivum]VAH20548.1 unnamed protein product [Triticum turgidum subsp. durum]